MMIVEEINGKIMVVDDEAAVRRIIRKKLVSAGYECIEVSDSREAMANILAKEPDLVILDIMMPRKSGRELLPEIIDAHPETAVIVSTSFVDPKTIIECMQLGVHGYFTKPLNVDDIVMNVKTTLQMKRLEKDMGEYQQRLEGTVDSKKNITRELFLNSIQALVYAMEEKDKYKIGHSRRVTTLSIALGEEMGVSQGEMEDLRWGALLHDVGKIAIDPSILNKADRLSIEEYAHVMTHTIVGAGIVKPVASQNMIEIISQHHHRFDGCGLEQRTRGQDIPLGARIVALADSFDAMTSDRPYRAALSIEKGILEILRCTGSQFDPAVTKAFLKVNLKKTKLVHTEASLT
jgi:putative two-component system response regulator